MATFPAEALTMETRAVAPTSSYPDPQQRTSFGVGSAEPGESASPQLTQHVANAGAAAGQQVKEHPIATVVVVAGLAFAIGALWKLGHSRPASRTEELLARLSQLPGALPRRWQASSRRWHW